MNTQSISIETPNALQEVINIIRSITSPDISHAWKNPQSVYYGEVAQKDFDIKNVRYGPMSSAPNIRGEVQEQANGTIVKLDIDIKSHYTIVRTMYYSTMIPIGLLILMASIFVLGDTEYWLQGYIFSGAFIAFGFILAEIEKLSLINMKKKELKNFSSRIGGKILSGENKNYSDTLYNG
jgi:hypothetical protein